MDNWYKESQNRYDNIPDKNKGGDCFTDSYNYMYMNGVIKGQRHLQLVHALIRPIMGSLEGVEFGHAWIEDGDKVIDTARENQVIDRQTFYMLGGLINLPTSRDSGTSIKEDKIKRYSVEDAEKLASEHQMYGPWDNGLDDFVLDNEEEDDSNKH
jgi:hypothetical protein